MIVLGSIPTPIYPSFEFRPAIDEIYPLLQALVPERYEGDLRDTLERILEPALSGTGALGLVLSLASFFVSNNALDDCGLLLQWISDHGHTRDLIWFLRRQTPTTRAFANALFGSATQLQNVQLANAILDYGGKLGHKLLYDAVSLGDIALTRRVLSNVRPNSGTESDWEGIFHLLVQTRQFGPAKFLLSRGVSVNANLPLTGSALYVAVKESNTQGIDFLVKAGADINLHCKTLDPPHTPLALALSREDKATVQLLLVPKTGLPSTIEERPILEWASLNGRGVVGLVQEILGLQEGFFSLEEAVDAASRGTSAFKRYVEQQAGGATTHQMEQALRESIKGGHLAATITLLKLGVDPNGRSLKTPLLVAALVDQKDKPIFAELLLDYSADVNRLSPEFVTKDSNVLNAFIASGAGMAERANVLDQAIECDDFEAAAKLIRSGVSLNTPAPRNGRTPLQSAAYWGRAKMVLYMLNKGVDINAARTEADGTRTALQAALEGRSPVEVGNLLLDHGADASAPPASVSGVTALEALFRNGSWSWRKGMTELCYRLLAAGATVHRPGGGPSDLLHRIIESKQHDMLRRFLGPPYNAVHRYYGPVKDFNLMDLYTPTQYAAVDGDLKAVEILLDHGADVNEAAAYGGRTALQGAAQRRPSPDRQNLCSLLLDRGADINAPPAAFRGITALQGAAISGGLLLAKELILRGADVNAPAAFCGRTALQGAAEHGRLDMVQLLLNAGATTHGDACTRAIELAEVEENFAIADFLRMRAAGDGTVAAEPMTVAEDLFQWESNNEEDFSSGRVGGVHVQAGDLTGEGMGGVEWDEGDAVEEELSANLPDDYWDWILGVGGGRIVDEFDI
ncbi:ankyrin repeat-containing domain protein [Chaetomium fimeti]|uniref:Ankyrin repeat-containing domain protein n=1 Tax=Chaetomium fimeti TaxID=1854472 RepID=A0AAE0HAR8_9PEZI|nr:ankyrin repeat-containing domain protein [Chaetomium fimeti]